MKSLSATLITGLFIFTACTYSPSYTIQGTLPDSSFDGEILYIMRYDDNKFIDSTVVSGRDFVFEGIAEVPEYCRIQAGRMYFANLVLENGEIVVDFDNHRAFSTTPLNKQQNRMEEEAEKLNRAFSEKIEELRETISETHELDKLMTDYYENHLKAEYAQLYKSFFEANKDNTVGVNALHEYYHVADPEDVDALFAEAGEWIVSRESVKRLMTANNAIKSTVTGKSFVDFTVEQEDGGSISLSDYVGKGKYVLVDFWASWCAPCIHEIPVIAEVYEMYRDKGLEVLGVAMWDKPNDTQNAIDTHNVYWPQIMNAQNIPAELYGISSVPYIILFGPDGEIIARGLRGDVLKTKVGKGIQLLTAEQR